MWRARRLKANSTAGELRAITGRSPMLDRAAYELARASGASHVNGEKRLSARNAYLAAVALCLVHKGIARADAPTSSGSVSRPAPQAELSSAQMPQQWQEWDMRLRAHLGKRERSDLDMIEAIPALTAPALSRTRDAFTRAGWPTAKQVFRRIVVSQLRGWADDESVTACETAWSEIFKTLRLEPEQCRLAIIGGQDAITTPAASSAITSMKTACAALSRNGFLARRQGQSPPAMDRQSWYRFQQSAMAQPEALSAAERDAIDAPAQADASIACGAHLKMDRNLQAHGAAALAAFRRGSYRFQVDDDVLAERQAPARQWAPAPADFTCPPTGTAFRLSNFGPDGRPVIHTVLGRLDFDCHIVSSVSGERGMLFPLYPENPSRPRNNFLRALWPLAVNKSVRFESHPSFGDDMDVEDKVTAFGPHTFCGKQIQAFEITEDISFNGGARRYKTINYWAPQIGFLIGQRTIVFRGPWPEENSRDWDILAMRAPPASRKL